MSTHEFKILINDEGVTGWYGRPGHQYEDVGQEELELDPLTLDTAGLMNRWLSLWDLIQTSELRKKESLLEPKTLKVLGTQLWRLVLDNAVGSALRERIPQEGAPAMRLSIEFGDRAPEALKGLPWEFLFDPDREWFLATKTELLLTRYVSRDKAPANIAQVGEREKLRALLIAALPCSDTPGDDKFAVHRAALWKLRTALGDLKDLDVPYPIEVWDRDEIEAQLKAKPCHIVHVVGICRGAPGPPKIYLGGGADGFQDPADFVESLTVAGVPRPRLVILQLCDYVDGDATENFERLAPDLIKRDVPAVLALQYVARVDQVDHVGLGKRFYQHLVEGKHIGAAVQASRHELVKERPGHRFGTPVLYLQEDGPLRHPPRSPEEKRSTTPSGAPRGHTAREVLFDVMDGQGLTDEEMDAFIEWVVDLDEKLTFSEAKIAVRDKLFRAASGTTSRRVYGEMYKELGRREREPNHVRS